MKMKLLNVIEVGVILVGALSEYLPATISKVDHQRERRVGLMNCPESG